MNTHRYFGTDMYLDPFIMLLALTHIFEFALFNLLNKNKIYFHYYEVVCVFYKQHFNFWKDIFHLKYYFKLEKENILTWNTTSGRSSHRRLGWWDNFPSIDWFLFWYQGARRFFLILESVYRCLIDFAAFRLYGRWK